MEGFISREAKSQPGVVWNSLALKRGWALSSQEDFLGEGPPGPAVSTSQRFRAGPSQRAARDRDAASGHKGPWSCGCQQVQLGHLGWPATLACPGCGKGEPGREGHGHLSLLAAAPPTGPVWGAQGPGLLSGWALGAARAGRGVGRCWTQAPLIPGDSLAIPLINK